MNQFSFKAGMKFWKVKGRAVDKSDMKQLKFRYTFNPKYYKGITKE